MKTSSKGMSEMLGRMQWKHLSNVRNVRKNAMTSCKCKSENHEITAKVRNVGKNAMKNLAKVSQKC